MRGQKHHVSRKNKDDRWKKSKYLGSLLGTEEDIKRRMGLAISTCNKFKDILESVKIGNITKARIYRTYVEIIFMYNSELWTLTKQLENEIDVFQR